MSRIHSDAAVHRCVPQLLDYIGPERIRSDDPATVHGSLVEPDIFSSANRCWYHIYTDTEDKQQQNQRKYRRRS